MLLEHCRYPRTGVPPLAVSRQGPCSYPWLRPNSRTPVVRSPVLPATVPDLTHGWEGSWNATCSGRSGRSARPAGGSGPPVEVRTPRESRTPHGVPDPLNSNRTPYPGKESTPRLGVVRSRHVSASTGTYIMLLGLHIKAHQPLHSLR